MPDMSADPESFLVNLGTGGRDKASSTDAAAAGVGNASGVMSFKILWLCLWYDLVPKYLQ